MQHLLEQGWAVSPGERYRVRAAPSIRVTTTALKPREAEALAAALASTMHGTATTYTG